MDNRARTAVPFVLAAQDPPGNRRFLSGNTSLPLWLRLSFLLFLLPHGIHAEMRWLDPVPLNVESGSHPSMAPVMSFATNGDLRVFYNVGVKPDDKLMSRARWHDELEFGREVVVCDEARSAGVHYSTNYFVDIAAVTQGTASIMRSKNYGHKWSVRSGYGVSTDPGIAPCYLPAFFTGDDSHLRLVYNYMLNNPPIGSYPLTYWGRREEDVWQTPGILVGTGQCVGAYEKGSDLCAVTSRGVYFSSDGGTNFVLLGDAGDITNQLKACDMAVGTDDRIYLLRGYSYGPIGSDQHLVFTYSDDHGTNWHSPQSGIVVGATNYMSYPRFAVDGDRMVVVWQHSEVINEYGYIRSVISEDGGQSWGPIETIVALTNGVLMPENGFGAVNVASFSNRTFLAYVTIDGAQRNYYIKELFIDSDDDGLADWMETNTGIYESEMNTGTDSHDEDTDDDGQVDGHEVVAKVDPHDGGSFFSVTDCGWTGNGVVSLEWPSRLGCRYSAASRTNLLIGAWTNEAGAVGSLGTGKLMRFTNCPAVSQTFYRIEVEPRSAPTGMVLVSYGTFGMGDHYGEGGANELPVHTNFIDSFYMDRCEVTGGLWQDVYDWATNHTYTFDNAGAYDASNHPVLAVSWFDGVKWCNARSEKEGLDPAYYTDSGQGTPYRSGQLNLAADCVNWEADGYRLPTEAEWEKAARGKLVGHHFPWNSFGGSYSNHIDGSKANCVYSGDTYEDEAGRDTTPVGYYNWDQSPTGPDMANGYGLYDMAGNVYEWCWDWYQSDWYSQPGQTNNPHGPASGSARVRRGGSWDDFFTLSLRCSARSVMPPSFTADEECGLRCVRSR